LTFSERKTSKLASKPDSRLVVLGLRMYPPFVLVFGKVPQVPETQSHLSASRFVKQCRLIMQLLLLQSSFG
jgi:hypothetical protein